MDIPEAELLNKSAEKPYRVAGKLYVKVTVKNDSDQRIMVRVADRFYQNRPQLFKDGKLVPYRGGLAESLQRQEEDPGFVSLRHVVWVSPYSSEELTEIDLSDWYGELEPGSYRLISRYRLDVHGPWTPDSAPLLFQVLSNANVLQELVSAKLITIGLDIPESELGEGAREKPYRLTNKVYARVVVKNNSYQNIRIKVVDRYYQNRPQLFRDGKLVPYRAGLAESLQKQEEYPEFVSVKQSVSVGSYSLSDLTNLRLNDWYGDLEPGNYRLINRYRLEIKGSWTPDSEPLFFEVVE